MRAKVGRLLLTAPIQNTSKSERWGDADAPDFTLSAPCRKSSCQANKLMLTSIDSTVAILDARLGDRILLCVFRSRYCVRLHSDCEDKIALRCFRCTSESLP